MSPGIAAPLVVAERDQSTPQSHAVLMSSTLPYPFVMALFRGGMYLAIDLTAGEHEWQSLEPLFANPAPRGRILPGKLAAISAFLLPSLVLSPLAFAVLAQFIPAEKLGMALDMGWRFAAVALALMLPLALPLISSMVLAMVPVKAVPWMYAVPLLGQNLGIMQQLRGVGAMQLALCRAGTLAAPLLILDIPRWVCRFERLAISG